MRRITQRSIGLELRQILFLAKYDGQTKDVDGRRIPIIQVDKCFRDTLDEQIKEIDGENSEFLRKDEDNN